MIDQLLNIPIHVVDYEKSLTMIRNLIVQVARPSAYVVQANVYSLVTALENQEYAAAVARADLSVPDGMPLVWLLRMKGHPIRSRVYGPDLMLLLCEEAARKGWRCFLYGGREGVPEQLRDILVQRFPGLQIVGTYSPPFRSLTEKEDEEICLMINQTKPDIVWVALGAPKQDIWMYEHREKIDAAVLHGVGAAFDFLSGRVRQAPRWMMNAGLEWLFRLFQEPKRLWRRYTVTNIKFIYYLLVSLFPKTSKGNLD
jgi:N-acetylglucosaminyldiphosphoundecaprenol N-acetyl-beta-D-mannosaminyltransferase